MKLETEILHAFNNQSTNVQVMLYFIKKNENKIEYKKNFEKKFRYSDRHQTDKYIYRLITKKIF